MTLNDLLRKAQEVINQLPTGDVLLYTEDGEPITDAFFEIEKAETEEGRKALHAIAVRKYHLDEARWGMI